MKMFIVIVGLMVFVCSGELTGQINADSSAVALPDSTNLKPASQITKKRKKRGPRLPFIYFHVLKNDGRFQLDAATKEAVEVLTACFTNTVQLLQAQFYMEDKASPVRTWPHHFDMATLVKVEGNPDPELAKSIGVGLSTGDETYQEPYFYVTPWPYPDREKPLPELPAGEWHAADRTGPFADNLHTPGCTWGSEDENKCIAHPQKKEVEQRYAKKTNCFPEGAYGMNQLLSSGKKEVEVAASKLFDIKHNQEVNGFKLPINNRITTSFRSVIQISAKESWQLDFINRY